MLAGPLDGGVGADGEEVHRWQGAEDVVGDEGGAQVCPCDRWSEEVPPLPPRHRRAPGDSTVSALQEAADKQPAAERTEQASLEQGKGGREAVTRTHGQPVARRRAGAA
jgi:hypothetical protein